MDFFKSVSARVGDVAKNVGDLLLDSDSESEADERSERTRRGGDDADRGEGSGSGGRRSRARGDGVAEGGAATFGASDSEGSEEDDGPLISEDVWNTLRAAKDRVARAAKTTVASVSRDVAAAAETVRRDLGDLSNLPGESTNHSAPVVFVGDAASEYAAGGAGGLGVSVESDVDDDDNDGGSDGDGSLDPDVAETFERTAEALENVGEKVERFGAAVFQNAGRLFDKIVDTFEEDDDDRGDGDADSRRSRGVPSRPNLASSRPNLASSTTRRSDSSSSLRHRPPRTADTPDQVFEKRVAAMQRDSSTYCDEPADASAFATFAKTFDASSDDTKKQIDQLLATNSFMKVMSGRIVPAVVEHDVFWSRYFFRLRALERERDGWEEPLPTNDAEPSGMEETPAGTAADAKRGENDAPDASASPGFADSAPSSDSPGRTSPEEQVVGEGDADEEEEEDARIGEEEEEDEEEEEEGTLPRGKTETNTLAVEIVRERVVVAGDGDDDGGSAPGHRRVVSLATDDGTVASDDSLGKDWTRVRDVESPSSSGLDLGEADRKIAAAEGEAEGEAKDDALVAGGSEASTDAAAKKFSSRSKRSAESSLSVAKPPDPEKAKDTPGAEEDSDLDEDWGMDSD